MNNYQRMACKDRTCGADDCPTCRPYNFIDGEFIEDIEARKLEENEVDEDGAVREES